MTMPALSLRVSSGSVRCPTKHFNTKEAWEPLTGRQSVRSYVWGVQDWEVASEVTTFLYACRVCHRCGAARALVSYSGTSCSLALSRLGLPSLSSVQSHQLLGLSHLTLTRISYWDVTLCRLFPCVKKDRRDSWLPFLELHLHHFLGEGDAEPHENLTGVLVWKSASAGQVMLGSSQVPSRTGKEKDLSTAMLLQRLVHIHSLHTTRQGMSFSAFSYRIPPVHIRIALSLAETPPSLGSFKATPFLPSALSMPTSFLERLISTFS